MKKFFEALLVFIIFYGVYSAFSQIAPMITPELELLWVVLISLVVATLLLLLYARVIVVSARQKLKSQLSTLQQQLVEKDQEIKKATSFKEAVVQEAEQALDTHPHPDTE